MKYNRFLLGVSCFLDYYKKLHTSFKNVEEKLRKYVQHFHVSLKD